MIHTKIVSDKAGIQSKVRIFALNHRPFYFQRANRNMVFSSVRVTVCNTPFTLNHSNLDSAVFDTSLFHYQYCSFWCPSLCFLITFGGDLYILLVFSDNQFQYLLICIIFCLLINYFSLFNFPLTFLWVYSIFLF